MKKFAIVLLFLVASCAQKEIYIHPHINEQTASPMPMVSNPVGEPTDNDETVIEPVPTPQPEPTPRKVKAWVPHGS